MKKAIRARIDGTFQPKPAKKRSAKPTATQVETARRKKIYREELSIAREAQQRMDTQAAQSRASVGVLDEVGAPGTRFPLNREVVRSLPPGKAADAELAAGMAAHNGTELPGYIHPLLGQEFEWTDAAKAAARLAAEGIPPIMVCDRLGIDSLVFERWMTNAEFRFAIRQYLEALTENVMNSGLANRTHRLVAQNLRWQAQKSIIAARAEDAKKKAREQPEAVAPGAETGWLDNKNDYDSALAKEMRETEKHGAIEVGQWSEGPPPVSKIEIVYVDKQLIVQHDEK